MASDKFYEQLSNFVQQNKHIGAHFFFFPPKGGSIMAIFCDRLEDFVIPDGLEIEKERGSGYELRSCYTGECMLVDNSAWEREI